MKDTCSYYILAYEDARQKRYIEHEYGGTTEGAEALGRAYPDGWVHIEYRGNNE